MSTTKKNISFRQSLLLFFFFSSCFILHAITPPELRVDGVLIFTSEGGVTDLVVVTENGANYDVSIDSDGSVSNYSYPVANVNQFRYLNMEMEMDMLNTTAVPDLPTEMSHYDAYAPKVSEMGDMLDLVRYNHVTVRSVQSGNWNSGDTWSTGSVPEVGARVLIEAGHTVKVNRDIDNAVQTVRLEGKLNFSRTRNSSLKVDTMVALGGSEFEMGTENNPIPEGVVAKLIIEDQGDFVNTDITNPDYDPSHLGLGFIAHGSVEIYGMKRTGYATFDEALSGATSIRVDELPTDWKIGDKIVLAGTARSATEDEARIITGLGGNVVSFKKPLDYNHVTPRHTKENLVLKLHVINLTRNAIITTQEEGNYRYVMDGTEPKSRGHVMFMHTNDVDIHYAGFYELGRTNKLAKMINKGAIIGPRPSEDVDFEYTTVAHNPIARYPCHFHRTGADGSSFGVVKGCAIDGSPGWGYVNHRGAVYIENNVAYNVNGASFISEVGNEIGTFINNVAIRTLGTGEENFTGDPTFSAPTKGPYTAQENINEFGSAGDGFWIHSHMVVMKDNVASGFRGTGFQFWNQAIDGYDRDPTRDPEIATVNEDFIEGSGLLMQNSVAYGGTFAYGQSFVSQASDDAKGFHRIENFVGFQVEHGIRRKYTKHTEYIDMVLIGDLDDPIGTAAYLANHNGRSQQFIRAHMEGFIHGIKYEKRKYAQVVKDGYFNNVYNIYLDFRHDRNELKYYINNTFGNLSEEALENVKAKLPGFNGVQIDYYAINDIVAGEVIKEDFEEAGDDNNTGKVSDIVVMHNGQLYKVYLQNEQHPDSIPPINKITLGDVTNRERSLSGQLTSVYASEMYNPEEVFEPYLPDVTYKNAVLGPVEHVQNVEEEPIRDIVVNRPENMQIGLDQGPLSLNSEDIFMRVQDNETPIMVVADSSREPIATIVLNGDGSIATITPISEGKTDIILETDTHGETTFELKVVASVPAPIANDDSYIGDFNQPVKMPILFNDTSDNELNGYEITIVGTPTNGTVSINSDETTLSYVPDEGTSGVDTFTYAITDYVGKVSNTATVSVEIREEAPDYTITLLEGESISLDFDGTVSASSAPSFGNVVYEDTRLTYTQTGSGHEGTDSFVYTLGGSTGTVTLQIDTETVLPGAPPTVNAGNPVEVYDLDGNGFETIQLDGSLSYDLGGDIVAYHWEIDGQEHTEATPLVNVSVGNHIATLTVTDTDANEAEATVIVNVIANPGIFYLKPVKADTEFNQNYFALNAVDGDHDIEWRSKKSIDPLIDVDSQNFIIELGRKHEIESIEINFGRVERNRPYEFKLYISNDEENWTEIASYSSSVAVSQYEEFTFSPAIQGKYVRFEGLEFPEGTINSNNGEVNKTYRIYEITGQGAPLPNVAPIADAGNDVILYDEDALGNEDGFASIVLDASGSSDPDLIQLTYEWEDELGGHYAGVNPEITLPLGSHEVTLTVTDLDGATAQDVITIDVVAGSENIALYKETIPSYTAINDGLDSNYSSLDGGGNTVVVDLGALFTLNDIKLLWGNSYAMDFQLDRSNDGTNWTEMESVHSNSGVISTIDVSGVVTRYVRLQVFRVSDNTNGPFDLEEFEIYRQPVSNNAPIANAGVDANIVDLDGSGIETFTLNGGFSSDVDGSIVNYKWSIPGYAPKEGSEVAFNFTLGETIVTLEVTDNEGAVSADEVTITVEEDPVPATRLSLYDFEDGLHTGIELFGLASVTGSALEVVDNPDTENLNPSDRVLKVTIPGTSAGRTSRNVGMDINFDQEGFSPNFRYLHCKVRADIATTSIAKTRQSGTTSYTVSNGLNTWEGLVFDLRNQTWSSDYIGFRLYREDEPAGGWESVVFYLDDIYLSNDPTPNTEIPGSIEIAVTQSDYELTDTDGNLSEAVVLDASSSVAGSVEVAAYKWTIPSVGVYTVTETTHTLDLPVGVYQCTLEVLDEDGNEGSVDFTVTINSTPSNILPVANAGADQTVSSDDVVTLTLDGTGSSDSDGSIVGYRWEIPGQEAYNGVSVDVDFPVGTTEVTLVVTDDNGGTAEDVMMVEVVASVFVAPVAVAGDDVTVEDEDDSGSEQVVLDASSSTDANDDIVSYTWDIPELGVYDGAIQTIDFPVGEYVVTLTVEDAHGFEHSDQIIVVVSSDLSVEGYEVVVPSRSGILYVTNLKEGTEMTIYDMTGRLVKQTAWKNEGISIEELPNGMYVLHLNIEGKKAFLKFLKR